MNYRRFYEKTLNIKLDQFFEVHHIDHDRKNNKIENLVAIPIGMHRDYHKLFYDLIECNHFYWMERDKKNLIEKIIYISKNIYQWVLYRDSILGNYESPIEGLSYDSAGLFGEILDLCNTQST